MLIEIWPSRGARGYTHGVQRAGNMGMAMGQVPAGPGAWPKILGLHLWTFLLEERLFPKRDPGTLRARSGVVIVAVPVCRERSVQRGRWLYKQEN